MPFGDLTISEGKIVRWVKQDGDAVETRRAGRRDRDRQVRGRDRGARKPGAVKIEQPVGAVVPMGGRIGVISRRMTSPGSKSQQWRRPCRETEPTAGARRIASTPYARRLARERGSSLCRRLPVPAQGTHHRRPTSWRSCNAARAADRASARPPAPSAHRHPRRSCRGRDLLAQLRRPRAAIALVDIILKSAAAAFVRLPS